MEEPRINFYATWPDGVKAQMAMGHAVNQSGLERSLIELVNLRASQMNGCAYCIDMHSKDALTEGETPQRLFGLSAWRETDFYTPRECAALQWTEAITNVGQTHAPQSAYDELLAHFAPDEAVKLTFAIVAINGWNRIALAFRSPRPGSYHPGAHS